MSQTDHIQTTPPELAFPVAEAMVRACRDTFGPTLRAVVLTGSLARNEGSYLVRDGRRVLQSDVEAMVVLHDGAALPTRHSSRALCRLAQSHLADRGIHVEVSFSVVHANYLRELPPHIYSYELRACGVVLFGEADILSLIPSFSAAQLSHEDAWRMLANRLIEQMESSGEGEFTAGGMRYRSIKLCLDVASAMLVFSGRFEAGYRARLERMEEFALTPEARDLPVELVEFMPLLRQSVALKLEPEGAADLGSGFEGTVTRWAWQAGLWQLQRMAPSAAQESVELMVRSFGRSQGIKRLLRGWLYAVRRTGWLASALYWPKWTVTALKVLTPRHAIYLAAYRWHMACSAQTAAELPACMESVRELLPIAGHLAAGDAAALATQLVWNYKEFTVETRA